MWPEHKQTTPNKTTTNPFDTVNQNAMNLVPKKKTADFFDISYLDGGCKLQFAGSGYSAIMLSLNSLSCKTKKEKSRSEFPRLTRSHRDRKCPKELEMGQNTTSFPGSLSCPSLSLRRDGKERTLGTRLAKIVLLCLLEP